MGRRSRRRASEPVRSDQVESQPAPRSVKQGPEAPWGNFPLMELAVFLALVIGALGLIIGGKNRTPLLALALALGSLAGLELSIREHFAGHRSHSTLLAGSLAAVALAIAYFTDLPYIVMLVVTAFAFTAAFWLLRGIFRTRSGGASFR